MGTDRTAPRPRGSKTKTGAPPRARANASASAAALLAVPSGSSTSQVRARAAGGPGGRNSAPATATPGSDQKKTCCTVKPSFASAGGPRRGSKKRGRIGVASSARHGAERAGQPVGRLGADAGGVRRCAA